MPSRMSLGNAELVGVLDMVPPSRDPTAFFPNTTTESWAPYAEDVLEEGRLQLYFGCFFVRTPDKCVLVDTGMGPGPHPDRENRTGDLINQLKLQGLEPEEVDIVVFTHLHPDHVGWNLRFEDERAIPNFPNAEYLVPQKDWDHFTEPKNLRKASYVRDYVVPLEKLGCMKLIDGETAVTDEISTLPTPGHTPGHQVILISSQGEKAMVVGDVLHSMVQVHEPEWCARVDINVDDSRRSREAVLNKSEHEGYAIAAGHFHPTRHTGRIIRVEGRRYWQSLDTEIG